MKTKIKPELLSPAGNLEKLKYAFAYGADAVYADGPWLVPASIWENTVGFGFALRDMEVNGTMERVVSCTTCHEPHNRNRNEHLLWKDNDRSGLCLTCHTTGRLSPRPVPRESGRPPLP